MKITIEEIKKTANLARLDLSSAEEERFAETISDILDYMRVLDEVEIGGVEQTAQVTGLKNVTRVDEVGGCGYVKELMEQMPEKEFGKLSVPGVFNGE